MAPILVSGVVNLDRVQKFKIIMSVVDKSVMASSCLLSKDEDELRG